MPDPYSKQPPPDPGPQYRPPYGPPPGTPPAGPPPYGPPPYGYGPYPPYAAPGYGMPYVEKHTGWFVVNWLFFWPLALYSLLSAYLNIDKALYAGDIAGAQYHARRVRTFGIVALCIGIAWIVIVILFAAVFTVSVSHSCFDAYGNPC